MSLFADYNLPFAIALGLMALFALVQLIGLGDFDFDAPDADADLDIDGIDGSTGFMGGLLSLLGLGRVPFMIWLTVFALLFALIGMSIQAFAINLIGAPLDALLASVISVAASLPLTGGLVRPLGRILPQDETSAVGLDALVGRRGQITTGYAAKAHPARTKVYDHHGQAHYVMVEPHEDASQMHQGDHVLLVRREGQTFFGVPLSERKLAPVE